MAAQVTQQLSDGVEDACYVPIDGTTRNLVADGRRDVADAIGEDENREAALRFV